MASQTQGIQQLLMAEKKAAEKVCTWSTSQHIESIYKLLKHHSPIVCFFFCFKVQEARKKKARRLKQAKEEASAEIERFRVERERAFREYEKKHMGSMYVTISPFKVVLQFITLVFFPFQGYNQRFDRTRHRDTIGTDE